MTDASPSLTCFHVVLSTATDVPWEGDIAAADADEAGSRAAAEFRARRPESGRITHLLVRALGDDDL